MAGCSGVPGLERCQIIQSEDANIRKATLDFFEGLDGRAGVYLVEVDSLLCPGGNPCPRRVDGIEVRYPDYDQTHFTPAGATWFAPLLLDRVMAAVETSAESSAEPSALPTAGPSAEPSAAPSS